MKMYTIQEVIEMFERTNLDVLHTIGGIPTTWTLYHNETGPGFFTPFNQKLSSYRIAGIKQAAIAATLLPAYQLGRLMNCMLLQIPSLFISAISHTVAGDWKDAGHYAWAAIFTAPAATIYTAGSFVLNLLKEITALITRSIATLVDMYKGLICKDMQHYPDAQINSGKKVDIFNGPHQYHQLSTIIEETDADLCSSTLNV